MTHAVPFDAASVARHAGLDRVPHADHWFGVWAIQPEALRALVARVERVNLSLHLQSVAADRFSESRPFARAGYELTPDGTAILDLAGSLLKHAASLEGTSTVVARRALRQAVVDPAVRAILLRLDSPGGTVAGTHDLAEDVRRAAARKPVWGYAEDLCCSAAYWIGSAADRLFANPTTHVGSIGTLMVVHDVSRAAEMDGVKVHVLSTGPLKGAGVPGTEITDAQRAYWQARVDQLNSHFLAAVAAHRNLSAEQVRTLATGEVWIAGDARKRGLIDGVAALDDVLDRLATAKLRTPRPAATQAADPIPCWPPAAGANAH